MTSDERPSVTTTDIIRHLWARRYLLLLAPPIFVVLTYAYSVLFMGEVFESSSTLLIRTAPAQPRDGPRFERVEAPTTPDLLTSDALLLDVVKAARAKFPDYPQGRFEELRKHFTVRTIMTRDTTIQATYSPAIILTAKGKSPEIALFLAEEWTRLAVERVGRMRAREAKQMVDTARAEFDKYSASAAELAKRQTELELQRDDLDALYASRQALLSGQPVSGTGDVPSEAIAGGLFGEKARLELQLASTSTDERGAIVNRLNTVDGMIRNAGAEIEKLNTERAEVRNELETVRRDLLVAREKAGQMRQVMTSATADSTLIPDPLNPEISGDLGVLSKPILAETRSAPKRSLIAVGGGAFLGALLVILLLVELYVRRTVIEAR